jgi:hypothetical protein
MDKDLRIFMKNAATKMYIPFFYFRTEAQNLGTIFMILIL